MARGGTYAVRLSYPACWDCQFPIGAGAVFCDSCTEHRRDGHEPVAMLVIEVMRSTGQWAKRRSPIREWCHGAGHNGQNESLLTQTPHPLFVEQYGNAKNPHMRRVEAAA